MIKLLHMCFAQPMTSVTPLNSEGNHAGKDQHEPQDKLGCLILAVSLTRANHGASQYEQANAYHYAHQFLNSFLNWIAGVITRPSVTDWIIALSAAIYAFFAYRQWQTIRQQAKATNRQAEIAQQTLVLTYRPKLIVRNVVMEQPDMRNWTVPQDIKTDQLFVWRLYVSNIGGTPATVTETGCWIILVLGELPMERPYEGRSGNTVITGMKVANKLFPGESGTLHIALLGEQVEGGQDPIKGLQGYPKQLHIYVMGWVTYVNDIGIVRRTAFCRRYDWARQYFVAVDNLDYEHAE